MLILVSKNNALYIVLRLILFYSLAKIGGFNRPIIHGLATLGVSVREVLKQFANNDASLFKAVKCRFTKPVYPGDSLRVEMWQEGNRIHFRTLIAESNVEVLSGEFEFF